MSQKRLYRKGKNIQNKQNLVILDEKKRTDFLTKIMKLSYFSVLNKKLKIPKKKNKDGLTKIESNLYFLKNLDNLDNLKNNINFLENKKSSEKKIEKRYFEKKIEKKIIYYN